MGYHWEWQPVSLKLGGGVHYFSSRFTRDDEHPLAGVLLAIDASIGLTWR